MLFMALLRLIFAPNIDRNLCPCVLPIINLFTRNGINKVR